MEPPSPSTSSQPVPYQNLSAKCQYAFINIASSGESFYQMTIVTGNFITYVMLSNNLPTPNHISFLYIFAFFMFSSTTLFLSFIITFSLHFLTFSHLHHISPFHHISLHFSHSPILIAFSPILTFSSPFLTIYFLLSATAHLFSSQYSRHILSCLTPHVPSNFPQSLKQKIFIVYPYHYLSSFPYFSILHLRTAHTSISTICISNTPLFGFYSPKKCLNRSQARAGSSPAPLSHSHFLTPSRYVR